MTAAQLRAAVASARRRRGTTPAGKGSPKARLAPLTDEQRDLLARVRLYHDRGFSHAQIAQRAGVPVTRAETFYRRAVRHGIRPE
jgi:hypothetical protein